MRAYPEYKDSGVEWLGEIPRHWEITRLKHKCLKWGLYGANISASEYTTKGVRFLRTTDISNDGVLFEGKAVYIPEEKVSDYILQDKDLLISRSGTVGRCFLYEIDKQDKCAYAGYLVRYVLKDINHKFVFYFTKTQSFRDFVQLSAIQSTIDNVNGAKFSNMRVLIPPKTEQTQIASYLDWKTAQINRFIRNKRRLIELLKEQKQSIINQAVTRGLDPNVKLKPSGVEWLGDVPEGWEVIKIKRAVSFNPSKSETKASSSSNEPIVFLPMENIYATGEIDCSEKRRLSEVWNGFTYFRRGDMILAKITPCFENGKGAFLHGLETDYGFGTTELIVLRPSKTIDGAFLKHLTSTTQFLLLGEQHMSGAAGQQRIPSDFVKNYSIGLPPIDEQRDIFAHIRDKSAEIGQAITRAQREIDLIQEYRTRLIADVVTGKIDVRGVTVPNDEENSGEKT